MYKTGRITVKTMEEHESDMRRAKMDIEKLTNISIILTPFYADVINAITLQGDLGWRGSLLSKVNKLFVDAVNTDMETQKK